MSNIAATLLSRAVDVLRRNDGSLLLGYEEELTGARDAARIIGLPISIFGGLVLAVLKVPRIALTAGGREAPIVTWHDGLYYDVEGHSYREKDLEWVLLDSPDPSVLTR